MSVAFFTQFNLTSPAQLQSGKVTCAAYRTGNKRCGNPIASGRFPEIREQHESLSKEIERGVENQGRADALGNLAKLWLCWRHQNENLVKAAVHQWENEIQSSASNELIQAQKVTPKKRDEPIEFKFELYRGRKVANDPTPDQKQEICREIDEKIKAHLVHSITKDPGESVYLYLFGHKNAKGVYKVGHTKDLCRLTEAWKRCYRKLDEVLLAHCPNAKLFEKLVHAEFLIDRRQHKCQVCAKDHGEWFEAPRQDLVDCINTWSSFAKRLYSGETEMKIKELTISLSSASTDLARWRDWAAHWTEKWSRRESFRGGMVPGVSVVDPTLEDEDDSGMSPQPESPMPELTPDSTPGSTPGASDDSLLDPPTPTPASRAQRNRRKMLPELAKPSPSKPSPSYFSEIDNDVDLTLESDTFWSPVPAMGPNEIAGRLTPFEPTGKPSVGGKSKDTMTIEDYEDASPPKGANVSDPLGLAEKFRKLIFG